MKVGRWGLLSRWGLGAGKMHGREQGDDESGVAYSNKEKDGRTDRRALVFSQIETPDLMIPHALFFSLQVFATPSYGRPPAGLLL